jgi:hypothetical protein
MWPFGHVCAECCGRGLTSGIAKRSNRTRAGMGPASDSEANRTMDCTLKFTMAVSAARPGGVIARSAREENAL